MAKAVVRLDVMHGNDNNNSVKSVLYRTTPGTANTAAAIENGNLVLVTDTLLDGEREVLIATTPAAGSPLEKIGVVCTPEVMYDETKKINEFENKAGEIARVELLHAGDVFSATADAFDTTPAVGKVVELQAGTKMKVVTSLTANSTKVGTIIAIDVVGAYTFYVVKVG